MAIDAWEAEQQAVGFFFELVTVPGPPMPSWWKALVHAAAATGFTAP